jgi:hypothetical protein
LVDDSDYDLVMAHRWFIETTDTPNLIYAATRIWRRGATRRVEIMMHKMLTGWPKTDHIDHNGLNNQRHNLRPATQSQNMMNGRHRRDSRNRFKGIYYNPAHSRKYRAYITLNGKRRSLGWFDDDVSAALAYDAAARELFGPYACLNFPDGHSVLPSNGIAPS